MNPNTAIRLVALVILLVARTAAAQDTAPLTNQDVTNLVRSGLSNNLVLATIAGAPSVKFDLSANELIALKGNGVPELVIEAMMAAERKAQAANAGARNAPERSGLLAVSAEPATILRNARTLYVDASGAQFFDTRQMKAALGNRDFPPLNLTLVDDRGIADVLLEVGYTPVWDYPFSLKHQNTGLVVLSGIGLGPFSGPLGATNVAAELVKLLKPYRVTPQTKP